MNPPRTCIFCGGRNLSGEHFWPKWAASILGTKSYSGQRTEGFIVKEAKTRVLSKTLKDRPGHVAAKKIRAVCMTCNNTWMSRIESAAKDIAIPIMRGEHLDISPAMQITLSEWITLKIMVGEYNRPSEAVTPQEDRDAFKQKKAIPSYFRIFIGRCLSDTWRNAYLRHAALLGLPGNAAPPNGGRKNTHTIAFGIGELFVFTMACVTEDIDLGNYIAFSDYLVPLWPASSGNLIWPHSKILSHDQANSIAAVLDRLIESPRTIWRPH